MRCSGSASIFPVRQPKQGRADQQRRWRPAQRLGSILPVSSDCSPRTRPLQPWRSRRRSLTAPPPSCCCQPRPRPAAAADHNSLGASRSGSPFFGLSRIMAAAAMASTPAMLAFSQVSDSAALGAAADSVFPDLPLLLTLYNVSSLFFGQ